MCPRWATRCVAFRASPLWLALFALAGCPSRSHVMQPVGRPARSAQPTAVAAPVATPVVDADPYAEPIGAPVLSLLPDPPAQAKPWSVPTTQLPQALLEATRQIFVLGFADPRGLPYHEIDVATGSVWEGRGPVIRTRGWLLPERAGVPRYAVAFNGLVYPVASVGPAADLDADVQNLLDAHQQERSEWARAKPGEPFRRAAGVGTTEAASVSHQSLSLAKLALLLRLERVSLAEALWTEWQAGQPAGTPAEEPLLALGADWLWAMFDRALTAHMRGDDDLALASVRRVPEVAARLETIADERGLPRPAGAGPDGGPLPRFGFVQAAAALRADQLRRHRAGPARDELATIVALPPAQQVVRLIEQLDQVAQRQWGQPGGVNLADDPIVRALIAVGHDAVEPLVEALETDRRLTRSVHFWRDFSRHRSILGVHEAAYAALAAILQQSFFRAGSTGDSLSAHGDVGRAEVARQIRDYWQKWRGVTVEERYFGVLADDSASADEWLDAAGRIVQRTDLLVVPGSNGPAVETAAEPVNAGSTGPMRGEPLRLRQGPSVTELLTRRLTALAADVTRSCTLALALADWDPVASRAALREQMTRVVAASEASAGRTRFGECIASLTLARAKLAKDPDAALEYGRWVERITPEGGEPWAARSYFEPMWELSDARPVITASRVVFGSRSPWVPLVSTTAAVGGAGWELADLLETPLLRVAAFREHVLRGLSDATVAGSCRLRPDGAAELEMVAGWSSTTAVPVDDPHRPAPSSVQTIRVSDYYAYRLSGQEGAPAFRPYWPLAYRNLAIAKMRVFVSAVR